MPWLRSRLGRVRGYGRLIVGLIATGTALVGVATLFADRFGLWGVVVFAAILVGGFVLVLLLPERAWDRLAADPASAAKAAAVEALTERLTASDEIRR